MMELAKKYSGLWKHEMCALKRAIMINFYASTTALQVNSAYKCFFFCS